MIKQTRKPIQLTKSMLINILRGMEAKHLKSASIYDRDSFERPYRNHLLRQINRIKYEQTLRRKGLRSQGVFITLNK